MSQFPRPRFQTPLPSGPSVGVQQVGVPDPVMGSNPVDRQLQSALGDLSHAVNIAGDIATNAANERARANAKAEMDAEKQRRVQQGAILRGIASDVRENLPGDIDAIKKGTLAPTAEDKNDPEIFLERLATERTIDVPEEYRDAAKEQFKSLWATRGLGALYSKRDTDQANAQKVAFSGLTDNLLLLDDPSKIAATMNEAFATIPGVKPEQLDSIASKAMFIFAKDGNEKMVNGFKKMLGSKEVDQQMRADDLLQIAKGKQEVERQQNFANEAASIREQAFNDQSSPELVKSQIQASAKKWGVDQRFVEDQIRGVNTAIQHQRDEQAKRIAYETVANELNIRNFAAVNAILNNAGDAQTSQTGLITPIDFQPIPGLPEELGSVKAQRARVIEQARFQTGVDLNNLDTTDGVNVNRWTRYVRAMAGSKIEDDQIKNTLLSVDFGTTDKTGDQVVNPQNTRAAQMYLLVRSINPNYAADMVSSSPQAKKFYDSLAIDMQTPGSKLSDQLVRTATAKGRIEPKDEASPGSKEYDAVLKAAPNLTRSLAQYAVRTYNAQKDKEGALEFAVNEAQGRAVQLWQPWAGKFLNKASPIAWFTDDNNAPTRPLVDLGTLASEDPSTRETIGTAMEKLLEQRAKDIQKLDPTLKTEATDLGLNYTGNGVWEVQGIRAGKLDAKYDHMFYVTDAQVRAQVQTLEDKKGTESIAELERQLANIPTDEQWAEFRSKNPTVGFSNDRRREVRDQLELKIKIRKLQESKKNP